MGTGVLRDDDLRLLMQVVAEIPGDLAEIGVFRGHLFTRLVKASSHLDCVAHAFDSFQGMAEPGPFDCAQYPQGHLSCGVSEFLKILGNEGILDVSQFRLGIGFVPKCFEKVSKYTCFRFAYIDLDHYAPTVASIKWVWSRLSLGGVIGFDDYFPGQKIGPTKAIEASLLLKRYAEPLWLPPRNNQVFYRRVR